MKYDPNITYISRNRNKNRYQVFLYEALFNVMKKQAGKIYGKESASLFLFVSGCYVLGLMGLKFEFFNDEDKRNIRQLHVRITTNR
jgi:hypothetical protein